MWATPNTSSPSATLGPSWTVVSCATRAFLGGYSQMSVIPSTNMWASSSLTACAVPLVTKTLRTYHLLKSQRMKNWSSMSGRCKIRLPQSKFGYALAFQTHVHKQVVYSASIRREMCLNVQCPAPAPTSCPFFPPYIYYPARARACGDLFVIIRTTIIPIGLSLTHSPRFAVVTRTPSLFHDVHRVSSQFEQ
jgi:hypothetical protein